MRPLLLGVACSDGQVNARPLAGHLGPMASVARSGSDRPISDTFQFALVRSSLGAARATRQSCVVMRSTQLVTTTQYL